MISERSGSSIKVSLQPNIGRELLNDQNGSQMNTESSKFMYQKWVIIDTSK